MFRAVLCSSSGGHIVLLQHLVSSLSVNGRIVRRLRADCINPLNAELNPICHLLALLGGATIVVVSRLRVKLVIETSLYYDVPKPVKHD